MTALDLPLERLQRWMQATVVQPGSVQDAVRARAAADLVPTDQVGDVILPTDALSSVERMGIYQGMYLMRMEEALLSDYPTLQHLLGPRRFFALVRDYVQVHPSVTYTLNRLGDHFPEFVGAVHAGLRRRGFCHDLARLELAIAQVFDEEEAPALSAEAIAAVPEAAW
ncbi:MAG: HvfC/BufC family peptide modification chaperone, partial [bacterium]